MTQNDGSRDDQSSENKNSSNQTPRSLRSRYDNPKNQAAAQDLLKTIPKANTSNDGQSEPKWHEVVKSLKEVFSCQPYTYYENLANDYLVSVTHWIDQGQTNAATRIDAENFLQSHPHWQLDMMADYFEEDPIKYDLMVKKKRDEYAILARSVLQAIETMQEEGVTDERFREGYLAQELAKEDKEIFTRKLKLTPLKRDAAGKPIKDQVDLSIELAHLKK